MDKFDVNKELELCNEFLKRLGMLGGSGTIQAYVWMGWRERAERSYPKPVVGIEEDHY